LNTHRYQLSDASYIAVQLLSAVLFRDSYALASSTGRVEGGGSHSLIPEIEEHRQRGHPFDTGLGEPTVSDQSASIVEVGALPEDVGAERHEGDSAEGAGDRKTHRGLSVCEGAAAVSLGYLKQAAWA
jgi:hypothetical protein